MTIFLNVLFLVLGMFFLIKGADLFVSSASSIAKRLKVPSIFIGLTIVALGTSLPELSVSIAGAISNSVDLSVANIVGSNMFNMLFILGILAIFVPINITQNSKRIDFPFLIAITGILLLFSIDKYLDGFDNNILSRTEGLLLFIILSIYLSILIINAKKERQRSIDTNTENIKIEKETEHKELKVWQIILYFVLGLAAVIFGGECVATTSKYLALQIGMSEALVGLTIVAIGTSLPELVTSVMAAKKGENDIALGNVVGSSIINIGLILGSVSTISKAPVSDIILTDLIILFVYTVIFSILSIRKNTLGKKEGFLLFGMYLAYLTFAIVRNYCF